MAGEIIDLFTREVVTLESVINDANHDNLTTDRLYTCLEDAEFLDQMTVRDVLDCVELALLDESTDHAFPKLKLGASGRVYNNLEELESCEDDLLGNVIDPFCVRSGEISNIDLGVVNIESLITSIKRYVILRSDGEL